MSVPYVNHSQSFAFEAHGEVWYSPNFDQAYPVPAVPSTDFSFSPDTRLQELQAQPQWWDRTYAWLGFVPYAAPFDGALSFLKTPVIVTVQYRFQLKPDILNQWIEFANYLTLMARALGNTQEMEHSVNGFPQPLAAGFDGAYRSHKKAYFCCRLAQERFVLALGFLSYMMSVGSIAFQQERIDSWFSTCVKLGVPERFLDAVKATSIFSLDGRVRRVGIFRRVFAHTDPPTPNFYIQRGVPIFYPWGQMEEARTRDNIKGKYSLPYRPPSEVLENVSGFRKPSLDVVGNSETPWEIFFRQRQLRQAARPISLTESQTIQSRQHKPARRNTKMFHWEENHLGVRVRTSVSKKIFDDIFDNYSLQQMRYDARENEWDVCTLWGDSHGSDDEDDHYFSGPTNHDTDPDTDPITRDDSATEEPTLGSASASIEDQNTPPQGELPEPAATEEAGVIVKESFEDLLRMRYGFVPPLSIALYPEGFRHMEVKEWRQLVFALGGNVEKTVKPTYAGAISDFIKGMAMTKDSCEAKAKGSMQASSMPPHILYDLRPECPSPWWQRRSALSMRIRSVPLLQTIWNYDARGIRITRTYTADDGQQLQQPSFLYEIVSSNELSNTPWALYVTTAVDALHCVRKMDQATLHEVARYLVENGIAFCTLLPLPSREAFAVPPPHLRAPDYTQHIPVRLKGYRFTLCDYSSYQRQREAILNQPHGRAALLLGGIIGRLARDILSLDGALEGPSSSVKYFGKGSCMQPPGEQDPTFYWNDALDQEELDIICGLHICHTGKIDMTSSLQIYL